MGEFELVPVSCTSSVCVNDTPARPPTILNLFLCHLARVKVIYRSEPVSRRDTRSTSVWALQRILIQLPSGASGKIDLANEGDPSAVSSASSAKRITDAWHHCGAQFLFANSACVTDSMMTGSGRWEDVRRADVRVTVTWPVSFRLPLRHTHTLHVVGYCSHYCTTSLLP